MDYNALLDLSTDIGYELAMAGAETFSGLWQLTTFRRRYSPFPII